MKINEMNISSHIKFCLMRAGYNNARELISAKDGDLLEIDGMKPSDVLEIRYAIDDNCKMEKRKQFNDNRFERIQIFEAEEIGVQLDFLGFLSYPFSEMIRLYFEVDNLTFNEYELYIDKICLNGIVCDDYILLARGSLFFKDRDVGINKDSYEAYSDIDYSDIKEISFSVVIEDEEYKEIARSKVYVFDCNITKETFKLKEIVDSFDSINVYSADNVHVVNDEKEVLEKNEKGFYLFNLYDKNALFTKEPNQGYLSLLAAIFRKDSFITYSSLVNNYEMYLKEAVNDVLSKIPERESDIISKSYGINDNNIRSLEDISKDYWLTVGRIREIKKKALRKLWHPSRSRALNNALYFSETTEIDADTIDYGVLLDELFKKEFDYCFSVENPQLNNLLCKNVIRSPRFNDNSDCLIKTYDYINLFNNADETLIIHTDLSINDKIMMIQKGMWYVSDFLDYYNIFFTENGDNRSIMIDDSRYLSVLKKYSTPILAIKLNNVLLKAMKVRGIQSFNQLSEELNTFPKSLRSDVNIIYEIIKNAYDMVEKTDHCI